MNRAGLILIVISTTFPAFQLFSLPDVSDQIALFSQFLGMSALILMAWSQIMATRIIGIESLFGGLDRVYVLHKWSGIAAMLAILLHDTIDAEIRELGRTTALNELAETLGEISLYGLLILVVISIATFVPYHLWRWTHKAMGALFAAGAFHFCFILKPFAMSDPAGLYTGVFCLIGIAAYIWTLLPVRMRPAHRYEISGIENTGGALAIAMTPTGKGLRAQPGQFGVFTFTGSGKHEPHPFSLSKIGTDGSLRVTIKALGDFTSGLDRFLGVGQTVEVQGPFGRFRPATKGAQVWIAGGIGITPFMAWAEALKTDQEPVDLFYCVRSRDQAPHLDELEALADTKPNLHLHIIVSSEGSRLTPEMVHRTVKSDLSKARVAFCGPVSLRDSLQTGLKEFGVKSRRFHYEEFEFRTGVGLQKLAKRILDRHSVQSGARVQALNRKPQ